MATSSTTFWKYTRQLSWFPTLIVFFGLGYIVHWSFSPSPGGAPSEHKHDNMAHQLANGGNEAEIWTCSMHPQIRQPRPGKCPICRMDLIPVSASSGGLREITISPTAKKLMELQTTPVERRNVTATIRMQGKITYDETRMKYITAWVDGRLEELYVDYTGIKVEKGQHMVNLYSPDLYSAQKELIEGIKLNSKGTSPLLGGVDLAQSAREKLRLMGMTPEQIKETEQRKKPSYYMTVYAPLDGIVIHKNKQKGEYVRVGDRIYAIADLSQVWVMLDAYESDLTWLRYGQKVTFTAEAYPGERFEGRIAFIDPVLNDRTRTVKVRVNLDNTQGKLKPDMFVSGVVHSHIAAGGRVIDPDLAGKWISPMHPEIVRDNPGNCPKCGMPLKRAEELGYVAANDLREIQPLVIPRSAALVTGTRAIVYVELPKKDQPTYQGREIVLGPRAGNYYLVKSGLKEGEMVVTNGNFKIDSALQIQAKPSMMTPEGGGGGGHQHGSDANKDSKSRPSSKPTMKLPAKFREQFHLLNLAFEQTTQAFSTKDLEKIRIAFQNFGNVLERTAKLQLLEGHPQMLWKEIAMLLRNDVVEGMDVKQIEEAERLYSLLKKHFTRALEQFGLRADGHAGHQQSTLHIPETFQKQIGQLWKTYLPVQQALAADDVKQATEAVTHIKALLAKIDAKTLPKPAQQRWEKEQANLQKIITEAGKAKDLKTLRETFSLLSQEMAVIVRTFGIDGTTPVYELKCSMAFGGRGGSWLQGKVKPTNPYFGKGMLSCADQVRLIAGGKSTKNKKEGHHHE